MVHILLWMSHLVPVKKRIRLRVDSVQTKFTGQVLDLLQCLMFWQALLDEGLNRFWEVPLFCQS